MIGEKKTTTGKGGCFEKSATIEESRVHGASSGDRRGSRGLRRLPRRSIVNPNSVLRSEEHTSELQSRLHLVCRLLLEKKKNHTRSAQSPGYSSRTAVSPVCSATRLYTSSRRLFTPVALNTPPPARSITSKPSCSSHGR